MSPTVAVRSMPIHLDATTTNLFLLPTRQSTNSQQYEHVLVKKYMFFCEHAVGAVWAGGRYAHFPHLVRRSGVVGVVGEVGADQPL